MYGDENTERTCQYFISQLVEAFMGVACGDGAYGCGLPLHFFISAVNNLTLLMSLSVKSHNFLICCPILTNLAALCAA